MGQYSIAAEYQSCVKPRFPIFLLLAMCPLTEMCDASRAVKEVMFNYTNEQLVNERRGVTIVTPLGLSEEESLFPLSCISPVFSDSPTLTLAMYTDWQFFLLPPLFFFAGRFAALCPRLSSTM